jgi:hypothetical protein
VNTPGAHACAAFFVIARKHHALWGRLGLCMCLVPGLRPHTQAANLSSTARGAVWLPAGSLCVRDDHTHGNDDLFVAREQTRCMYVHGPPATVTCHQAYPTKSTCMILLGGVASECCEPKLWVPTCMQCFILDSLCRITSNPQSDHPNMYSQIWAVMAKANIAK